MLFHGISGDHIQGIMEEMERRSKTESRLAKGMQLNGRESVRVGMVAVECAFAGTRGEEWVDLSSGVVETHGKASAKILFSVVWWLFLHAAVVIRKTVKVRNVSAQEGIHTIKNSIIIIIMMLSLIAQRNTNRI